MDNCKNINDNVNDIDNKIVKFYLNNENEDNIILEYINDDKIFEKYEHGVFYFRIQ